MRTLIALAIAALALGGCAGDDDVAAVDPLAVDRIAVDKGIPRNAAARRVLEPIALSGNRGEWAGQIGHNRVAEAPHLVRSIREVAEASGVRVDDVTVYDFDLGELAPAVRLQSKNAARYLKHDFKEFLEEIGFSGRMRYWLVEVYDGDGSLAWVLGVRGNGGMAWERPELIECFGAMHTTPVTIDPVTRQSVPSPPCPG